MRFVAESVKINIFELYRIRVTERVYNLFEFNLNEKKKTNEYQEKACDTDIIKKMKCDSSESTDKPPSL